MKRLVALCLLVGTLRCASSEVPGISEVKLETLQGWKVRVENMDPNSLVAFTHILKCPKDATHRRSDVTYRFDPLLNYGSNRMIEPGAFHGFGIPEQFSDCPGGIVAAVFSDGHSVGDPEAVRDIYRRRLGVKTAIGYAKPLLEKMRSGELALADLRTVLAEQTRKVSQDDTKMLAERQGETYVYARIISSLNSHHTWQIPSDLTAKKQPGVEEVMKSQGIPADQALAFVIHRKLKEWETDLQGNIER